MAVQGLENMMKVNVIHFKRGPDTSKDKKKFNFVSDAEGDGKNSHAPQPQSSYASYTRFGNFRSF